MSQPKSNETTPRIEEIKARFAYLKDFPLSPDPECSYSVYDEIVFVFNQLEQTLHHQLQKAREEERERIEAVFKEHVPPHAMDLEDSVWLKRLLNKAFGHD